jgi:hypothetical protein
MGETITEEQVVGAARELNQAEFTRSDLAGKLDIQDSETRQAFREAFQAAKRAGSLEKVRKDDDGTGVFRLTASSPDR